MDSRIEGLEGLAAWVPRRLLLAIDIMLDVAFNGAAGPLPAAELGVRRGLETRQIEAILQRLVRSGLLRSIRGPNGGYILAGERTNVTIGTIARSLVDPERSVPIDGTASASMRAVVLPLLAKLDRRLLEEMDRITLDDLCHESRRAGLPSKCDGIVDFAI